MINIVEDWHWWVLGTLLLVMSSLGRSSLLILLGIAGVVVGFLLTLDPFLPIKDQLGIFAVLSVTLVLIGQFILKPHERKQREDRVRDVGRKLVGRTFILGEDLTDGVGTIKHDGEVWTIEGRDMRKGTEVRVISARGEVLRVANEETAKKAEAEFKARQS